MYLKNTSKAVSVVINTARGKVGIRPEEVVDIKYKILPPISTAIKEVSEEEYLCFQEGKKGFIESIIDNESDIVPPPQTDIIEDELEGMDRVVDVPPSPTEQKDNGILGFVNAMLDKKENTALVVNETDSTDEVAQLEQQIKDLKISWKETKSPKKKEKLAKEIKELQKQLDRLGK